MVSLARTIRNIRRVGLRDWWRQMQYIGDAKAGALVGTDQCVGNSDRSLQQDRLRMTLCLQIW